MQQLDLSGPVLSHVLIWLISIFHSLEKDTSSRAVLVQEAAKKVQGKKLGNLRRLKVLHDRKLILNDIGIIQNLQMPPIPQTSFLPWTFFAASHTKIALELPFEILKVDYTCLVLIFSFKNGVLMVFLVFFDSPLLTFCNTYKVYRIKHPNSDSPRTLTEPVYQIISVTIQNYS